MHQAVACRKWFGIQMTRRSVDETTSDSQLARITQLQRMPVPLLHPSMWKPASQRPSAATKLDTALQEPHCTADMLCTLQANTAPCVQAVLDGRLLSMQANTHSSCHQKHPHAFNLGPCLMGRFIHPDAWLVWILFSACLNAFRRDSN